MIDNMLQKFTNEYEFQEKVCIERQGKHTVSQHELMNAIHQEFQRSFIHKLYPHLEWTERIFWNVAGTLQQKYYEDLSLDEIITAIKRYLTDHKMIVPRS